MEEVRVDVDYEIDSHLDALSNLSAGPVDLTPDNLPILNASGVPTIPAGFGAILDILKPEMATTIDPS